MNFFIVLLLFCSINNLFSANTIQKQLFVQALQSDSCFEVVRKLADGYHIEDFNEKVSNKTYLEHALTNKYAHDIIPWLIYRGAKPTSTLIYVALTLQKANPLHVLLKLGTPYEKKWSDDLSLYIIEEANPELFKTYLQQGAELYCYNKDAAPQETLLHLLCKHIPFKHTQYIKSLLDDPRCSIAFINKKIPFKELHAKINDNNKLIQEEHYVDKTAIEILEHNRNELTIVAEPDDDPFSSEEDIKARKEVYAMEVNEYQQSISLIKTYIRSLKKRHRMLSKKSCTALSDIIVTFK